MKKSLALAACLLAPVMLSTAFAETPAPVQKSAAPQNATAPLNTRLRALLDGMETAQSSDFYEAAKLVLAETGDPAALYSLMEEASGAGSAAATVWLLPLEINRLNAERAVLATDPRAVELRARVEAAVKTGYRPAYVLASNVIGMGIGGEKDEAAATRYLVEGSKAGCQQARAGYLLLSGRLQKGGAKDPAVAAELGRNNYYLEEMLAQAAGDTAEGVKWARLAGEHGSAVAPFLLAQSQSAKVSEQEALKLITLSAERHHPDAMDFLGNLKLRARELTASTGIQLEEDREGGLQLLRLAAALGHPSAAQVLATAMLQGMAGEVSAQQVCALLRMAAEQGDPQGMAGYGYCLMAGRGCAADAAKGEALLERAASAEALWANQALASVWYNGLGVKPDLRRAVSALGEDAAMGSAHAYAIMAAITALGNESTPGDAFRARVYLDMAREEDPEAQAVYDAIIADKGWRFLPALWAE